MRLREKLDLADTAAAELDVMTLDGDFAVPAVGVDLLLHRVDIGDRGIIEIFAPDEGRELAKKRLAGRAIARARARLDQCRPLPIRPRLS